MAERHTEHTVVRLLTESGRWPTGTIGTIVEANETLAMVEIADEQGRAVDLISLPHGALTTKVEQSTHAAS